MMNNNFPMPDFSLYFSWTKLWGCFGELDGELVPHVKHAPHKHGDRVHQNPGKTALVTLAAGGDRRIPRNLQAR